MNPTTHRREITLLPEHLIDQIKAGEIVERPASVVKELVENAIDAGADSIAIELAGDGLDLIAVQDNGQGMRFEDIPRAFCRHSTSKLNRFEDLYELATHGFRGEALASVASVARIQCTSCPQEDPDLGGDYRIEGGRAEPTLPFRGREGGTSVWVRDLFYNTPARLKFIKSKAAEKNAIKRILNAFILANAHIRFAIGEGERDKNIFPAASGTEEKNRRIARVLFKKKYPEEELLHFTKQHQNYRVEGHLSVSSHKGYSGRSWYILANNRLIEERGVHQSVLAKMEHVWPAGHSGNYLIAITVPPGDIDVNVHPNKTRVKFLQSAQVYGLVRAGLDQALEQVPKVAATGALPGPPSAADNNQSRFAQKYLADGESIDAQVISLGPRWHLFCQADQTHLLCLAALVRTFWINKLTGDAHVESPLPLMISEPIEDGLITPAGLAFFKTIGLEMERLDADTLALRSIPPYCEGLPLPCLLWALIPWAQKSANHSKACLLDFLKRDLGPPPSDTPTPEEIKKITREVGLEYLGEQGGARLLSDALLESLFHPAIRH